MSPGDILFVPRGDVHKAVVEGENSIHLTIGLQPRLGHEAVAWLALSRRVDLPSDGGAATLGTKRYTLTADQSRLLAAVLAAEVVSIGELATALPVMDVPAVAGQLAATGLIEALPC